MGRDEDGIPRYAHSKGTAGNFRLDVKGSDKAFNFCYRGEGERLFVFEAPVDLLSFLCLFKKDWQKQSYLALGGVGEKALLRFLSDRLNIKTVYLCLDNDNAGNDACSRLAELVPEGLTVHRLVPLYKDWNEVLQHRAEIADGKYIREAIYGLKEPPQEETVEIIRMSEVDTQTVEWLWEPYIPFGKVTIVQGNPGEGKTTFALRLAAACTTGGTLPGMKPLPPFNGLRVNLAHADNLDGFFLRRLFQAVNRFPDILGRYIPSAQAPQGGCKRRFRLGRFQGRGIAAPGRNHRREVYPGSGLRLERAAAGRNRRDYPHERG